MSVCPACGQENPEIARFCLACAASLAAPAPAEAVERKLVSVLFVDLVGHTAASDQVDPEDVRARLQPYHQLLKREIERYGGTVEKFIGDAVMAVFGAPVSHEDDAERAVRSALRILQAVHEHELELEVRAAVATGEAVVSLSARPEQGEGIVAGDVVNTASRLQQAASPGSLVVGEVTERATRDTIEYEELEPVSVKGKAGLIPVWRALEARTRLGVDAEPSAKAPFVGRGDELRLLTDTYTRAFREASIQLVTITGEPGVGKTRLTAEFRAWLENRPERARWLQGRCLPYGEGITFWALGEIVKAHAGILESDSPEDAAGKLDQAVSTIIDDASDRDWLTATLAPLVGAEVAEGPAGMEAAEAFTAWRRFLEAVATQRPLVLLIEDLHWADPKLVEFIEHIVDWSTDVQLLIVCTARPELYERRPGWGGGKRNSTTIALAPLSGEQTARLLSALLSRAVLPAETQAALLERAGGNPLYAEEFVRMLTDRGFMTERGQLTATAQIAVPETVQAVIAARLDTLSPEKKALLHDASVVGKVFWTGAVASIAGIDRAEARTILQDLVRKELVRPARTSSVKNDEEFSFWHVLVRDVTYGQIPRAQRGQKHRAAAEWIERIAAERVVDQAEILAHHYGEALALARASGVEEERLELERSARRFLVAAGDRALNLDVAKAEVHYRKALELLPEDHPERASVIQKLAETAWLAGRFSEAERGYEEAIAESRKHGDLLAAGGAMVELGAATRDQGNTVRAGTLLAEAVDVLEQKPPGRELALAYMHSARDRMLSGRYPECLEWAEKARELAQRLGFGQIEVRALQFRGIARFELGDLDGIEDSRESLEMCLELGLGYETVTAYGNLSDLVLEVEGPVSSRELRRQAIEFGERRGIAFKASWVMAESVWELFDLGEWDELLEMADRLIDWEREHGGSQVEAISAPYRAHVLLLRGMTNSAASAQTDFLPRAREIGDIQVLAPALAVSALIRQASGDLASAVDLIEELERLTRGRFLYRAHHLPDALRVCVDAESLTLGESLFEGTDIPAPRARHLVLTGRAIVAEGQGNVDKGASLFAKVASRWKDFGCPVEQAQALLGRGRCLAALGRRGEAEAPLQEARGIFLRLRATPLVAKAEALLGDDAALAGS